MRYIHKAVSEPQCLADYKKECAKNNVPQPYLYKDFNRTSELRRVLVTEQHNVCCYCQRHCKAYRTEHSYPENGQNAVESAKQQLEYSNLFASCIDSSGSAPQDQYCDVAKSNTIIREFIKDPSCQSFFRYNLKGEIIPNGQYRVWSDYEKNIQTLTKDEKDAHHAICVLNLNRYSLVDARKKCLDALFSVLEKKRNEECKKMIENWLRAETFPDFIELRIQYIEEKINTA